MSNEWQWKCPSCDELLGDGVPYRTLSALSAPTPGGFEAVPIAGRRFQCDCGCTVDIPAPDHTRPARSPMGNASLIANSQTMLDNGSRFSNTDISRILSALMVADSELLAAQAAIQRVLNLIGDIGPEARRILTQLPDDTLTVHDKRVAAQSLRDAAADIHARGDVGEDDGPTIERYLTIRAKNIYDMGGGEA